MQDPSAPSQPNTEVHRLDGIIRMMMWGLLIFTGVNQLSANGTVSVREYFIPFTIFALLMAGYVLVSVQSVAHSIRGYAEQQPVLLTLLPLLLVVPYAVYAREQPEFDPATLLASGMLLFLPISCALLNTPQLKPGDVMIGLVTVALPLVGPLLRNEAMQRSEILLRLGAFALPLLLLLLTRREQKARLNFLFICAVLSLWFSIEFAAFPEYILPNTADLNYFSLAVLPVFLYVLALSGRFEKLGLSFKPSLRGAGIVLLHLLGLALILVPIGLTSGFLKFNWSAPQPLPALSKAFAIYLFVALPEELLFRGTLLTYLKDALDWPDWGVVAVSSLIFGLSHLNTMNNAPDGEAGVWWLVLLATLAGVAYARAFLLSKNVATSAALHTAVDWLWNLAFR